MLNLVNPIFLNWVISQVIPKIGPNTVTLPVWILIKTFLWVYLPFSFDWCYQTRLYIFPLVQMHEQYWTIWTLTLTYRKLIVFGPGMELDGLLDILDHISWSLSDQSSDKYIMGTQKTLAKAVWACNCFGSYIYMEMTCVVHILFTVFLKQYYIIFAVYFQTWSGAPYWANERMSRSPLLFLVNQHPRASPWCCFRTCQQLVPIPYPSSTDCDFLSS